MRETDILIIGGGPAGLTAGIYAARAGLSSVVLESMFPGGQAATTADIANYPGFPGGISGPELTERFAAQYTSASGTEIMYDGAASVDLKARTCVTAGGETITAKAVILCMGAQPRTLNIPGEAENRGRGVSYCATCDGMFFKGKRVTVIGGGDTAIEDTLYLKRLADVTLVHRRDSLRATGVKAASVMEDDSVHKLLGYTPVSVEREGTHLRLTLRSVTDGTETVHETDGIFIAAGTVPQSRLITGQIDTENGYVIAGEDTRTSLPGVFAAGDIRKKLLRQVVTAVADGAVAAEQASAYIYSMK